MLSSDPSSAISPRPVAAAAASKAPPRPAAKAAAAGRKALKDALKQQAVAKKSQAASAAQNSGGGGAGAFGAAGSDGGDADNDLFARCAFVRGADLAVRTGGVHVVVVECKWQETNSGHARTSSAWHGLLKKGPACVLSTHKYKHYSPVCDGAVPCRVPPAAWARLLAQPWPAAVLFLQWRPSRRSSLAAYPRTPA